MDNWMNKLATHYETLRGKYPHDKLLLLFDIDGTILDTRHMIHNALAAWDRNKGTTLFSGLLVDDITVHENHLPDLLKQLKLSRTLQRQVCDWVLEYSWTPESIEGAHLPFAGVMEIIRWFQMQPNTFVGLNTGRQSAHREMTLKCLNNLGREFKVSFPDALLYMNRQGADADVSISKMAGVIHFLQRGYRVAAFIDNEPENLRAVSDIDLNGEILLLHADTIFETERNPLPDRTASGAHYDITQLAGPGNLPQHIEFVWHRVDNPVSLEKFLISNIRWGQIDICCEPLSNDIVIRRESFKKAPFTGNEKFIYAADYLDTLKRAGKSAKLDLRQGGRMLIDSLAEIIRNCGFEDSDLWFNGANYIIGESGFLAISALFPGAIIQCPIDFISNLIVSVPDKGREMLDRLAGYGINRFSINWDTPDLKHIIELLESWDMAVNIYDVPDLESFLGAVLMNPRSITSDFNFPKWSLENLRIRNAALMADGPLRPARESA